VLARFAIAALDTAAELELLLGREERYLVDFLEVRFEATFGRNGSAPDGGSWVSRGLVASHAECPSSTRESDLESA